ncbi:MAG TPA: ferritin-like protein [Allosphingosinicella sp.]|jgi:rubrerythrin|nr:ferritin-like protein [Allosphingosinicella sp.]
MTDSDPQHAELPELVTQLLAAEQPAATADKAQQREAIIAALNGAVLLEFATIPPYLTALWTIKDERHPLANSLRNILQEEMLHLALVCNMLVSIGGEPQISSAAPTYPGKLPLGVHPELIVPLGRFSKRMLDVFIEIERPKDVPPDQAILQEEGEQDQDGEEFTIGQLYGEILASFRALDPEFSQDRQVTGPLAWIPILSLEDVEKAIEIIERQGEGSTGQPEERRGYLAHYWRFAEMHRLQRMEKGADGKWAFGTAIAFDFNADVWPVGDVPEGGYQLDPASEPEARHLLHQFNIHYSKLLDYLQATWSGPAGQAMILMALEEMFELEKFAKPLMRIARPDGQNYSPDFRYLLPSER